MNIFHLQAAISLGLLIIICVVSIVTDPKLWLVVPFAVIALVFSTRNAIRFRNFRNPPDRQCEGEK